MSKVKLFASVKCRFVAFISNLGRVTAVVNLGNVKGENMERSYSCNTWSFEKDKSAGFYDEMTQLVTLRRKQLYM